MHILICQGGRSHLGTEHEVLYSNPTYRVHFGSFRVLNAIHGSVLYNMGWQCISKSIIEMGIRAHPSVNMFQKFFYIAINVVWIISLVSYYSNEPPAPPYLLSSSVFHGV